MPVRNMVQAINSALAMEMERDPSVVILGEERFTRPFEQSPYAERTG